MTTARATRTLATLAFGLAPRQVARTTWTVPQATEALHRCYDLMRGSAPDLAFAREPVPGRPEALREVYTIGPFAAPTPVSGQWSWSLTLVGHRPLEACALAEFAAFAEQALSRSLPQFEVQHDRNENAPDSAGA